MLVVLDTNVLIDGFADDHSVPARLINAVRDGEISAVVTPAIVREYRKILQRLISDPEYAVRIEEFLAAAISVVPQRVDVTIDDQDDVKFIAAATSAKAPYIITHDRHLLDLGEVGEIRIITPPEAWALYQDEIDSAADWHRWASDLGLG